MSAAPVQNPLAESSKPALEIVARRGEAAIAAEVRRGLSADEKWLSPALFYDDRGSQLFSEITRQPEYYLTRAEREILLAHGAEILAAAAQGQRLSILELGAGTAEKTGILLAAAVELQGSIIYQPVDVSASALDDAVRSLGESLPQVRVQPVVADYTQGYENLPRPSGRRLALYIGSSIGNFEPVHAANVLHELRTQMRSGDSLLLGTDLSKDEATLVAAYNDAAGVTADFNRNVLTRINRELDADFHLDRFRHEARWNTAHSRMEMHLVSTREQKITIPGASLTVEFRKGESIHTENSYKFTAPMVQTLLSQAGFRAAQSWTDPQRRFLVSLASV